MSTFKSPGWSTKPRKVHTKNTFPSVPPTLRMSLTVHCSGAGFGKRQKKAKNDDPVPGTTRKVKRVKSKGKSTMRMQKPPNYETSILQESRDTDPDNPTLVDAASSPAGLISDQAFSQRLSELRKENRNSNRARSIYDADPDGLTTKHSNPDDINPAGPNQGLLVGLSVVIIGIYVWVTIAAG